MLGSQACRASSHRQILSDWVPMSALAYTPYQEHFACHLRHMRLGAQHVAPHQERRSTASAPKRGAVRLEGLGVALRHGGW
jgi:hypothetical protein